MESLPGTSVRSDPRSGGLVHKLTRTT